MQVVLHEAKQPSLNDLKMGDILGVETLEVETPTKRIVVYEGGYLTLRLPSYLLRGPYFESRDVSSYSYYYQSFKTMAAFRNSVIKDNSVVYLFESELEAIKWALDLDIS